MDKNTLYEVIITMGGGALTVETEEKDLGAVIGDDCRVYIIGRQCAI